MFISLLSHVLCAWFAFALPAYATYKALAHSPSLDTLQALSVYWAVIGAFVAVEQTLGSFLSWLPFYWELRTVFLLYISLPQTNGAPYVYKTLLEPWLLKNERDIDDAMTSAQSNVVAFCQTRFAALVDLVRSQLDKSGQGMSNGNAHGPLDNLKSLIAAFAPKDPSDSHVNTAAN